MGEDGTPLVTRRAGANAVLLRTDDEWHSHEIFALSAGRSCHDLATCACTRVFMSRQLTTVSSPCS